MVDGSPAWGRLDGDAVSLDDGKRVPIADAVFLAPVEPTKIIATHLTYRSRVDEYAARMPPEPSYFMKPPTTLNGHRGLLRRPARRPVPQLRGRGGRGDRQARCTACPRTRCSTTSPATPAPTTSACTTSATPTAARCCGSRARTGSARSGRSWYRRRVRPDRLRSCAPTSTARWCRRRRRDDLIWPIAYLLADLCRLITLEPGDVVLSGTPAHSRPMEPGDVVAVEVTGLGRLDEHGRRLGRRPGRAGRAARRSRPTRCTSRWRCPRTRPSGPSPRELDVIDIRRIDHVALRVADLDEAVARWSRAVRADAERRGRRPRATCAAATSPTRWS